MEKTIKISKKVIDETTKRNTQFLKNFGKKNH